MSGRQIMSADEVRRATVRIGHEIVEKQAGTANLALVGILQRGLPLAQRMAESIREHAGTEIPVGGLDVSAFRDDGQAEGRRPHDPPGELPFAVEGLTIVLVDDVLYTGRTIRAALDALVSLGRPGAVRLAVLVDRGHRELPIRADHVGKNVPTARDERVLVRLTEVDGDDSVEIERLSPAATGAPSA